MIDDRTSEDGGGNRIPATSFASWRNAVLTRAYLRTAREASTLVAGWQASDVHSPEPPAAYRVHGSVLGVGMYLDSPPRMW